MGNVREDFVNKFHGLVNPTHHRAISANTPQPMYSRVYVA